MNEKLTEVQKIVFSLQANFINCIIKGYSGLTQIFNIFSKAPCASITNDIFKIYR